MFRSRRQVGVLGEKVPVRSHKYDESLNNIALVETLDGLDLSNVDNKLAVTTSVGEQVILGMDVATPVDVEALQARIDALTALVVPQMRPLGTGTPAGGASATSWSNSVTVSNQDGLNLTGGSGTILIGDDWVFCLLVLEGSSADSTGLGNIDKFTVDVDYPTNAMIEATVGAPNYDSNMINGGGSASAVMGSDMTATCVVSAIAADTTRLRVTGQWYNRMAGSSEGIQIRVFFVARATTTPASRDFNGVGRLTIAANVQTAAQIKFPEDYDYVDIVSEGLRIAWCHGTGTNGARIADWNNLPTTTSDAVSISALNTAALNTSLISGTYDILRYSVQSNVQELASAPAGFEYWFMSFTPNTNGLNAITGTITNVVGTTTLASGWYTPLQEYVVVFARVTCATAAVRTEFTLPLPSLYPVASGAQVCAVGFSQSYLESNMSVWADNSTTVHARLNVAQTGASATFRIIIVYHSGAP